MKKYPPHIQRMAAITAALMVVALFILSGSRQLQGIVLAVHSILCMGLGAAIATRRWNAGRGLLLGSLYVLWALADLGWSVSYFFLHLNSRSSAAVILTESFYFTAFLAASVILIVHFERPLLQAITNRVGLLAFAIATPVATRLIVDPFLQHSDRLGASLFNLGETTAILSSYLLLCLSLIGIVSSRSLRWSQVCGGMACLVFGDWAMRFDKLLEHQAQFGVPSFLVLFGLYFSGTALLLDTDDESISRFDPSSLIASCKLWMLLVLFGFMGLYCAVELGSLESLRTLSIAVCFGALIAVFGSETLIGRVRRVSEQIGGLLRTEAAGGAISVPHSNESLPLELRDTYEAVFSRALQDLKLREERRRVEEQQEIQRQVAHDIRSPLTALLVVSADLNELAEPKRVLLRTAVTRIQDIANNLLVSKGDVTHAVADVVHSILISSFVDSLVSEKRLQYRSRMSLEIDARIDPSAYSLFSKVHPVEFKRMLSNLINNGVEALDDRGAVTVLVEAGNAGKLRIIVRDTGRGIPSKLLPKLGEKGKTFAKDGGHGLGLAHAKEVIANWGGELSIRSKVGEGTDFVIELPMAEPPHWFVPRIELDGIKHVAILDDDASIHQIWKKRFGALTSSALSIHHFSTAESLREWVHSQAGGTAKRILFLVDYELLGQGSNGIDVIRSLGIKERSILVTSRFDEPKILSQCEQLGVRMIPKGMAGIVPISSVPLNRVDCVLIDNDPLVRLSWEISADKHRRTVATFESPDQFVAVADRFPKNVPVYVDIDLGEGLDGRDVSKRLYEMGFKEMRLATGFEIMDFPKIAWVREVVAKQPPFGRL